MVTAVPQGTCISSVPHPFVRYKRSAGMVLLLQGLPEQSAIQRMDVLVH